jgi:tetratricopeptide (TPR) repeat protein
MCDFIQYRWGDAKLLDMVHAYARVLSTREVIQQILALSAENFDQQFQSWLYERVRGTLTSFDEWHTRLTKLAKSAQSKQYDDVIRDGGAVIRLYPDYVDDANAYELLAQAYMTKDDKEAAARVLQSYVQAGGRRPAVLEDLARLQETLGDSQAAAATLDRINYIDPAYDQEMHKRLGALWLAQKNYAGAIREYGAVLALHPLDAAGAQFDLARAYFASGQLDKAEDAVLASLEAAPNYRPAQKLLLQLKSP